MSGLQGEASHVYAQADMLGVLTVVPDLLNFSQFTDNNLTAVCGWVLCGYVWPKGCVVDNSSGLLIGCTAAKVEHAASRLRNCAVTIYKP
eukprot:2389714-Amphidinium_carterae.4